jgi:hypothetical protein
MNFAASYGAHRFRQVVERFVAIGIDQRRPVMTRQRRSCETVNSPRSIHGAPQPGMMDNDYVRHVRERVRGPVQARSGASFQDYRSAESAFGSWGAQHLGLLGDAAEAYAQRVVEVQLKAGGNQNVVNKLAANLGAKDPMLTAARIQFELEHFAQQTKRQLMQQ